MDMKSLVTTAILALAALWTTAALGQVYGGEDDPYQQSPFASNSYVPPSPPDAPATTATAAPVTAAPVTAAPVTPPPESGKAQQAAASSDGAPAKKPAQ
jgi:hypothetical protein